MIDLFDTTYAPADGPNGGQVVIGAALEASQFNPFFVNVSTEAAVASATWATLTVVTSDGRFAPDLAAHIPTIENGGVRVPGEAGDAMTVTSHIFADITESTAETPCALVRGNFDLALHSFDSSIDPVWYYYSYHSSQFPPDGANDARVSDPEIDAALDAVRTSVDFEQIRESMADFQANYVEKTVEIPLFYRKQVALHAPQLGNFVDNPTQAGPTWNVADWYLRD